MQLPQVVGIAIGVLFILSGFFLRKLLVKREKKTSGGVVLTIFAYLGGLLMLQNIIFSYPPTWSWEGVKLYWIGMFGKALVPIIFGFIGLAFSPNRVIGYVFAVGSLTGLMMMGSS
ncbi:hypothetical protein [Marinobacter sp. ST-43]|jgi:hypothetical protein|uniref:hypothetical protein n=1 Tax=Marinobacter sp. ST-43 TaxID=3050453 RepID=UPI0026E10BA2|nr:hypothetical protein [Marinobacter sp. ST-43]